MLEVLSPSSTLLDHDDKHALYEVLGAQGRLWSEVLELWLALRDR